jgi:putative FmdB family regulatory protein
MPIYEFHCEGCESKVEIFQRTAGSGVAHVCPRCGSEALTRLISRFAVHRQTDVFASADEERYIESLENEDPNAMAQWAGGMGGGGLDDFGGDGSFDGGEMDDFE